MFFFPARPPHQVEINVSNAPRIRTGFLHMLEGGVSREAHRTLSIKLGAVLELYWNS